MSRSLLLLGSLLLAVSLPAADTTLDLAGTWRVALDPTDMGRAERWFERQLAHPLPLPGSLQQARMGNVITVDTPWTGGIFDRSYFTAPEFAPYREPGNIKVPFWLQPETHYTGAAWYQRTIDLPPAWAGRRIVLTLERPHWTTTVWIDAQEIGTNNANSVAHAYDLGTGLSPGPHTLTIRVDNRLDPDIGENSHSISDHTQGNWNGIVGRIELTTTAPVWIDDVRVTSKRRTATIQGRLGRSDAAPWPATARVTIPDTPASLNAPIAPDGTFAVVHALDDAAALWDEFTPTLHRLTVSLENGERRDVTFGLRDVTADGRQLTINGRPLFLRGALDCAAFPRTGHPPTGVAEWKRIMSVIKAHGLNHVRFHSWCPPEAAFVVADELGLYLQVEVASWPNQSTTLGDGKPVDAWIEAETARILRAYGNHPSFIILCAGNEPGGPNHPAWLSEWVTRWKAADPDRLYTAGAGWPDIPENDLHERSEPRIQHWLEGLASRINAAPPETRTDYGDFIRAHRVPVVSHEIGQWCVFPNFAEMAKYTGYLKPRNFEIFRESLAANGLRAQAHEFLIASGKLQALCYKEDIESALRTPEMGGFQLLGLADFPGQGTALVGVLDAFWEEKGYITPEEFRRFCASTVPLVRLDERVFTADEHLVAGLEVAHYGAAPLAATTPTWQLVADDGTVAAEGTLPVRDIPVGAPTALGRIDHSLASIPAPARYKLVVSLETAPVAGLGLPAEALSNSRSAADREAKAGEAGPGSALSTSSGPATPATTTFVNDWDIWVYPRAPHVTVAAPPDVTITSSLNAATLAQLDAGAAVLLMIPPARVAPDATRGPIALGFSSIFWNTAWTNGQAPHTLGILCDPQHPALAQFPTDAHSNWQWWYPLHDAAPMILGDLPADVKPIVQVVDDWFTNRKLALVFEARVGRGRLLVTSIDLGDAALDPVRRQLRASLLAYAANDSFQPTVDVTPEQLRTLFTR